LGTSPNEEIREAVRRSNLAYRAGRSPPSGSGSGGALAAEPGNLRWNDRTTGVGTVTYASPEQLHPSPDVPYSRNSDMYSLGIILFELLNPLGTMMERAQVLKELREGELPEDFVRKWPKEATLVLWLMSENPDNRPSARELMEFELLRHSDETDSIMSTDSASNRTTSALAVPPTQQQNTRTSIDEGVQTLALDEPHRPGRVGAAMSKFVGTLSDLAHGRRHLHPHDPIAETTAMETLQRENIELRARVAMLEARLREAGIDF
ncbi:hypothetical protein BDK51DRAFT_32217, partial [Blyttiomyces helicus]